MGFFNACVDFQFVPPRINNMLTVVSEVHKLRVTSLLSHPSLDEVTKEINQKDPMMEGNTTPTPLKQ